MKTVPATIYTIAASLLASTTAFASASPTNKVFVSGPLILLFLGFCALVVVVQCIPAIIMFYGMLKGTVSLSDKKPATAKSKK